METRLLGQATETRERGAALERPVWQVRHDFGQHRVPVGDDDLPAAHVQGSFTVSNVLPPPAAASRVAIYTH